jgi:hypothetical protein
MKRTIGPIGALLALLFVIAIPTPSAQGTDEVYFELYYGSPPQLYIEMETTTQGAIIFYTVGWNGYAGNPTHNGSTPGSGTYVFHNQVGVPYGQTRYYAAVAWTQAEGDSGVEYYEQHNPNW